MAATRTLSPLKWHGGKHYLAKRIIELMPPHLHYVEPFFGGGQVLLARDPSRDWFQSNGEKLPAHLRGSSEVINDINGELMNFWRTLREPELFEKFYGIIQMTPFSETLFDQALVDDSQDDVKRAVNFFIRARQSRQGLMTVFATVTRNRTRGRRNEQANAWWNVIDGLPDIHERLKDVLILNHAAIDVIRQQDGPNTLFYCDPPYVHETRKSTQAYEFEMTEDDHNALLAMLTQLEGKVILSGYRCELYDDLLSEWNREDIPIDNKASSAEKKEVKVECLWMNFEPRQNKSCQASIFDEI